MSGSWPSIIDPVQLAEKGTRFNGDFPLKGMRRLLELCANDAGSVQIDLRFEHDEGNNVRVLWGTINARVHVTCQRCLEPFALALHSESRLVLLTPGEQPALLEPDGTPVDSLVIEHPLSLSELIEDELLLVMPMIPNHAPADCAAAKKASGDAPKVAQKKNPFSVLEQLKRTDG